MAPTKLKFTGKKMKVKRVGSSKAKKSTGVKKKTKPAGAKKTKKAAKKTKKAVKKPKPDLRKKVMSVYWLCILCHFIRESFAIWRI